VSAQAWGRYIREHDEEYWDESFEDLNLHPESDESVAGHEVVGAGKWLST
jgi:hypothetical protein